MFVVCVSKLYIVLVVNWNSSTKQSCVQLRVVVEYMFAYFIGFQWVGLYLLCVCYVVLLCCVSGVCVWCRLVIVFIVNGWCWMCCNSFMGGVFLLQVCVVQLLFVLFVLMFLYMIYFYYVFVCFVGLYFCFFVNVVCVFLWCICVGSFDFFGQ